MKKETKKEGNDFQKIAIILSRKMLSITNCGKLVVNTVEHF